MRSADIWQVAWQVALAGCLADMRATSTPALAPRAQVSDVLQERGTDSGREAGAAQASRREPFFSACIDDPHVPPAHPVAPKHSNLAPARPWRQNLRQQDATLACERRSVRSGWLLDQASLLTNGCLSVSGWVHVSQSEKSVGGSLSEKSVGGSLSVHGWVLP